MSYKPNLKDTRVKARIKKAIGFSLAMLPDGMKRPLANTFINKYFGRQSSNLGSFLRQKLLICTDHYYSQQDKQCKTYVLNQVGVDYLLSLTSDNPTTLSYRDWSLQYEEDETFIPEIRHSIQKEAKHSRYDNVIIRQFIEEEYSEQFESGDFSYSDKAYRLWNPIQNLPRAIKKQVFVEQQYYHNYDIDACAPTLILQYARQLGFDMDTPYIDDYLSNKTVIRNKLALESESDVRDIKILINALWCGARMSTSPFFALSLVIPDKARMMFLKQHPFIVGLRKELKELWKCVQEELGDIEYIIDSLGRIRTKSMSSYTRWQIYFQLERKVADAIDTYVRLVNIKSFREHDGFVSNEEIDTDNLIAYVKGMTGYDIKLSYENLNTECEAQTLIAFNPVSHNSSVFAGAHTSELCSQSLSLSFFSKTPFYNQFYNNLAEHNHYATHTLVSQKSLMSIIKGIMTLRMMLKDQHYIRKKQLDTS